MRRLDVCEWRLSERINQLVLPPSDGTPVPLPLNLRELDWRLDALNFSFLPKFLSPYLTTVMVTTDKRFMPIAAVDSWDELPDEVLPIVRTAIKMFPYSPPVVCLKLGIGPETRLTEEVSAYVLGCGGALREFATNVVLSTQAIVHLMKLPNLRCWTTEQGPPQVAELIHHGVTDDATPLFPSLWNLDLRGEVAFEWISLFESAKSRDPPWIMAGGSLPMISYHRPSIPVDSSLISRFLPFADLVELRIRMECMLFGPCKSHFTDEDVERLVTALPKLEVVTLCELPCDSDTCPTTIRSLLSFSLHCPKLRYLNIHFRVKNLREEMLDLLTGAYSQGLHSRPKCILKTLVTQEMPLELSDYNLALFSMGMLMIFPSLDMFVSRSPPWIQLEALVNSIRQTEGFILSEQFMSFLDEVRESVGNDVHMLSAVSCHFFFGSPNVRRRNYPFFRLLMLHFFLSCRTKRHVSFAGRFHQSSRK